jgi:hypothetical protein
LLQSDEELQSAVERARAFERRHDPRLRVGVYDHYPTVLADMMIVPPKDIDRQIEVDPRAPAISRRDEARGRAPGISGLSPSVRVVPAG